MVSPQARSQAPLHQRLFSLFFILLMFWCSPYHHYTLLSAATKYSAHNISSVLCIIRITVHHASPFRPPRDFHLSSTSPTSQKNLRPASLLFSLFLFLSFFSTLPMWKYRPSSRSDSTSGVSFDPPRRNWFGRSKKKSPFCKLPLTLSHFLFSLFSLSIFIFFSFSCCFLFLPIPSFIPSFQVPLRSPDGDHWLPHEVLPDSYMLMLMLMPMPRLIIICRTLGWAVLTDWLQ